MHGSRNDKIKKYMDYYSEWKLKGEELRFLVDIETLWLFEDFIPKELPKLNIYFKLLANLLWLEENFEENKKDISYLYAMMGYYVGIISVPPNCEEIGINYLNKAIEYSDDEKEKGQFKYYIEEIKGPDGTPELYDKYFD